MQLLESSEPIRVQAFSIHAAKQVSSGKVKQYALSRQSLPTFCPFRCPVPDFLHVT